MTRPSEPFNAEERDLAERLARLGGPREPAPALDAKILAMARAAVTAPAAGEADADAPADASPAGGPPPDPAPVDPKVTPLRPRPRRATPRWPLGMGLAASLVLAAGIGWKLHDNGQGLSEQAAAPAAAMQADAAAEDVIMFEPAAESAPTPPPPPPPPLEDAARTPPAARAPAADAEVRRKLVVEEAAPVRVYSAEPAPAPPAPPPPPAPVAAQAPAAAPEAKRESEESLDRIDVSGSRIRRTDRDVGAAEFTRTEQDQRRRQAATERAAGVAAPAPAAAPPSAPPAAARGNQGVLGESAAQRSAPKSSDSSSYDDRPPVSADSPEFRQAWLQRIRELLAKGDQAWARESLREFRRRYPDAELPEDLKPLAASLTTP